jgi:hypothetical protein
MNKIILLFSFLFSTTVWANVYSWDELEPTQKYTVASDIPFDENLTLKAGSPLYFQEVITGMVPVMLFVFNDPNCTDPGFSSEMTLFNPEPEDTSHNKTIGVQYSEDCSVQIYVEPQYYYNKSIFQN